MLTDMIERTGDSAGCQHKSGELDLHIGRDDINLIERLVFKFQGFQVEEWNCVVSSTAGDE